MVHHILLLMLVGCRVVHHRDLGRSGRATRRLGAVVVVVLVVHFEDHLLDNWCDDFEPSLLLLRLLRGL